MSIKGLACFLVLITLQDTCFAATLEEMAIWQFWTCRVRKLIKSKCLLSMSGISFKNQQVDFIFPKVPVPNGLNWIIFFEARYTSDVFFSSGSTPNHRQYNTSADIEGEIKINPPHFLETEEKLLVHKKENGDDDSLNAPTEKDNDLLRALEPQKAAILLKMQEKRMVERGGSEALQVEEVELTKILAYADYAYTEYSCGNEKIYAYYSIKVLQEDELKADVTCPE